MRAPVRIVTAIALFAAAAVGSGWAQPPKGPPGKVKGGGLYAVRHVRESQAAVVVVNPARLTRSATAAGLPIDVAWKDLKGETGLDAKSVARAELYITPFPGGNVAFDFAAAVRFTGPVADKQTRALLAVPPEKKHGMVAGKWWYESPRYRMGKDEYWAAFLVDATTAVFATRRHMMETAVPTDKVLPLAQAAETIDLTAHDVVVVALPGVIREKLDRALAGQKEPWSDDVMSALERLKVVVATLDLDRDPVVRIEFRADSEEGAAVAAEKLKKLLGLMKAAYPAFEKQLKADLPKGYEAVTLVAAEAIMTKPVVAVEKAMVVVTIPRPAEFTPKAK
jgi:hypothetical protein